MCTLTVCDADYAACVAAADPGVVQYRNGGCLAQKCSPPKEKKIACASEEEMSRLLPSASMWRGSRCHATPAARGNGIEGILSQHA
jgi:hypothetical protein